MRCICSTSIWRTSRERFIARRCLPSLNVRPHAIAERGEALNPAALNALYKRLVEDYFGPELVMDEEVQYEWARIPHF